MNEIRNSIQQDFESLSQSLESLRSLLDQIKFDSKQSTFGSGRCWDEFGILDSVDVNTMLRYLANNVKRHGFEKVKYYLFLENPSGILPQQIFQIFSILRRICIQELSGIYAKKVEIHVTEDSHLILLEIIYSHTSQEAWQLAQQACKKIRPVINNSCGEMVLRRAKSHIYINIAV